MIPTSIFIFILAACIGSFLNVCVYRLPRGRSLWGPRSFCPHCSRTIPWYDNVPILSFIILWGRCRFCEKEISLRYPLGECLSAFLTLMVWNHAIQADLHWTEISIRLLLTYALIVVTLIDLEFYIIPDEITYGGLVVSFFLVFVMPGHWHAVSRVSALLRMLLGLLAGGGSLFLVGEVAKFLMKKEAMGLGDVKLMAMVGALLGWKTALFSIMMASIIGSVVGVLFILMKRLKMESRIPFGPFLSLGTFIFMMWGDEILRWYLNLLYVVRM